ALDMAGIAKRGVRAAVGVETQDFKSGIALAEHHDLAVAFERDCLGHVMIIQSEDAVMAEARINGAGAEQRAALEHLRHGAVTRVVAQSPARSSETLPYRSGNLVPPSQQHLAPRCRLSFREQDALARSESDSILPTSFSPRHKNAEALHPEDDVVRST